MFCGLAEIFFRFLSILVVFSSSALDFLPAFFLLASSSRSNEGCAQVRLSVSQFFFYQAKVPYFLTGLLLLRWNPPPRQKDSFPEARACRLPLGPGAFKLFVLETLDPFPYDGRDQACNDLSRAGFPSSPPGKEKFLPSFQRLFCSSALACFSSPLGCISSLEPWSLVFFRLSVSRALPFLKTA